MEGEITKTILKLRDQLSEKYGKDFKKFYLVNFDDTKWEGLIVSKEENKEQTGVYYKIDGEKILSEN